MNKISYKRNKYIKRNTYYYKSLNKFFSYNIFPNSSILEVGCGIGNLVASLPGNDKTGIDISSSMIDIAQKEYPDIHFISGDAQEYAFNKTFDYIIVSDTLSYINDVQKLFSNLKKASHSNTRIILSYHNVLWEPLLNIAELFRLKMPHLRLNWLGRNDVENILFVEGYEVIKNGEKILSPIFIPIFSWILNKFLIHLPFFNLFSLVGYTIARPIPDKTEFTVTVLIPARNEAGNIETAIKRMPKFGNDLEIIFVEGGSNDNTQQEIERVAEKYKNTHNIRYTTQDGKGKGDAVRKGFNIAKNEILMILDADLTVPPEDLPKFYNAIRDGKGEFINGTRLVYPLEKDSMRFLNVLGNKFFSLAFSWLLDQKLKDTLCGTKVLTKYNWNRIIENRKYFGDFDPFGDFDMLFGASKLNLKITEIPIRYQAREYGDTNISRFSHGFLLLKMTIFALFKLKLK